MITKIMRVIFERAWPKDAIPCPACGNNKRILYVESPGMVDHYQCPCGWFSMRSGGWAATVRGWNADVCEWRRLHRRRKCDTLSGVDR